MCWSNSFFSVFGIFVFGKRKSHLLGIVVIFALILYCKYATFSHSHQTVCLRAFAKCKECLYRIYNLFAKHDSVQILVKIQIRLLLFISWNRQQPRFFNAEYPFCCQKQQRETEKKYLQNGKYKHAIELIACRCLLWTEKPIWANKWK